MINAHIVGHNPSYISYMQIIKRGNHGYRQTT